MGADTVKGLMRKYKKEQMAEMILELQEQLLSCEKAVAIDLDDPYTNSGGIILATDGTVQGTRLYVDGESIRNLTSLRAWINKTGLIEISYEQLDGPDSEYRRVWLIDSTYPENEDNSHFESFCEVAAEVEKEEDSIDLPALDDCYEYCDHCFGVIPLLEDGPKPKKIQCGVCRQWTEIEQPKTGKKKAKV